MRKGKFKSIISLIANTLYTLIFLFVLLITVNALRGTITHTQPAIFGYTVSQILSPSMTKSGFSEGDYVVTKAVSDASSLKAADGDAPGDIISFYVHKDSRKPVLKNDNRSDAVVFFHEIVGIDESGAFITKGSSNSQADEHHVPFESVSGAYVETGAAADFIIKAVLAGNRFLYWVILVFLLVGLRQFVVLIKAIAELKIQREVTSGERRLLDKECFSRNLFGEFGPSGKQKILKNAPSGLSLLYGYLLYGKVSKSDEQAAAMLKGKRCGIVDVLCLTYAKENGSEIDKDEYIKSLPPAKKGFEKYRSGGQMHRELEREKTNAFSLFLACLLFFVLYMCIAFATNYFATVLWYEILIIFILPAATMLFYFIVKWENKRSVKKLEESLRIPPNLPERYHFIMYPDNFSKDEVEKCAIEIETGLQDALIGHNS